MVLKNTCNILDQELAEAVNHDTRKNEIFVSTRGHIEEIIKAVKHYLRDSKKQYGTVKANNELLKSVTEVMKANNETKTGTFPHHSKDYEEHKGEIVTHKGY